MVRVALIGIVVALVTGAGVWFSRHLDPEVARLLQSRAKQRLEKANVSYLAVEASGRDVTVTLPPGAPPSTIASVRTILATIDGIGGIDVRAFGEGGRSDDRIRRMLPKERLATLDTSPREPVRRASEFPVAPAAPETAPRPRRSWDIAIGRSQGGRYEEFELGARK
jgi:hypothetical protein